jgi:hypothetical protein
MKTHNRYKEARGLENLGDKMDQDMVKKYGKSKEIPAFINAKEGRDENGKEQSISYGNSGEGYESE